MTFDYATFCEGISTTCSLCGKQMSFLNHSEHGPGICDNILNATECERCGSWWVHPACQCALDLIDPEPTNWSFNWRLRYVVWGTDYKPPYITDVTS